MECRKCYKPIALGQGTTHRECGHHTHLLCLDKTNPNFRNCVECEAGEARLPVKESASFEGHDYVRNPVVGKKCDPELKKLFEQNVSIESFILGDKLYLQEMLHLGVTIDTFLKNGYTCDDLLKFQDLASKDQRVNALFALQCNADHFRAYPGQLPVAKLGITPQNLINDFGLSFEENWGPLCVGEGAREWTMADLYKLGFTADDVYAAGLHTLKQFNALAPTEELTAKMGFTQHDIDMLYPPKQQPARKRIQAPVKGVVVQKKRWGLKK